MHPIYDDVNKITIWWSAKCGCSTIKYIYYNIIKDMNIINIHFEYNKFDSSKLHYKNILVVRNPYDRIVSTFLNKYINEYSQLNIINKLENIFDLTFEKFVLLLKEQYVTFTNNCLNKHHTTPQFSEAYNNLSKYCIENNIDFKFDKIYKLEEFDSTAQKEFISYFKETSLLDNINIKYNVTNNENNNEDFNKNNIYYLLKYQELLDLKDFKKNYKLFYNNSIRLLIETIYKVDFDNLKKYDIEYSFYK